MTKDQILSADDRSMQTVDVPEWGGPVNLRVMTGFDRDDFELSCVGEHGDRENVRAKLLVRCICDDNGNRIFADDDYAALGGKSAAVLDRLWDKASAMNGIGQSAADETKKNLSGANGSDSATA